MEAAIFPVHFGEWLKRYRNELDLTQAELARRAGCSVPALRKIESGDRRPSKQLAGLLARSLEIPTEDQGTFIKVARGELNPERLRSLMSFRVADHLIAPKLSTSRIVLPFQPNPLIGREAELAALGKLLAEPDCRLLTIIGMGGIGKTRLAIELASTQKALYPGGVHHVRLAPLNSPELIVTAIATTMGMSFFGSIDPKEQLINFLSIRSNQPWLLVLDHLEHLLAPSSKGDNNDTVALLLAELLLRLPMLKILATSIERINIKGEWTFELHGLPYPTGEEATDVESFSAATMFIKHARQVKADFQVEPNEQISLARVCQLVEGVPLAIELAATWVGMLSIPEIAQEIETNLDFLNTSMRGIPERHRSLRAVFEYSCRFLLDEECSVLCQLSVFRGGFNRDAAKQVAGANLASLMALMSKSFLFRLADGRYDLHDIIRHFALGKLKTSGQFESTSEKFLIYLVALINEAQAHLMGPKQFEWINLLDKEIDNLRAAFEWAFSPKSPPERVERGLQMIVACIRFWQGKGHVREALWWLERGLKANDSISVAVRAEALGFAGWLATYLNDSHRAYTMLRESIAIYRQLDDKLGLAKALDNMGDIAWFHGDYTESKACYEESLALLREHGDPYSIGLSLYSTGRLHVDHGFYLEAETHLKEALSLLQGLSDMRGIAMCTNGLGRLALFQDNLDEALQRFSEALKLNYELGHKLALMECLRELAVVALLMDQEPRAIQLWAAATKLQRSLDITFPYKDPINRKIPQNWIDLITSSPEWRKGHGMSLEEVIKYALGFESLVN